jgi:hypothetical protein
MSHLVRSALLAACLLASATASADPGAPPPPFPPAAVAPSDAAAVVAPSPPAPLQPAYPVMPYAPAYPPPYLVYYPQPGGAPPPSWMPESPTVRRSNALRTTGIVLFGLGGALSTAGAVIFGAIITHPCEIFDGGGEQPTGGLEASQERVRSSHQALNGCDDKPGTGVAIIAAGAFTALVGLPLFVIGSKQVPARSAAGKLVPEVSLGAGNGSLRWTF